MKKLKTWQKVLLIIFYPVGIIYFIVWLCNRNNGGGTAAPAPEVEREVIREIYSNVVGCVYPNKNGTSRQTYIAHLKVGEDLAFKPAPTEEYPDSIGVFTSRGEQIGAISYQTLNELRGLYLNNDASVTVNEILHSERGLGVNMLIKIYK